MDYLEYNVGDMLNIFKGLDKDTIVKIKLDDGNIIDIGQIAYNKKKEDIVYIEEIDKQWLEYHKTAKEIVDSMNPIVKYLNRIIESNIIEDTDWALDCIMIVAIECDYWLNKLGIEHDLGPGTGADNEIVEKLILLEEWVRSH